jgi:acyl-coenzyme A synthetase/AMP-(fatty) acid ligase
MPHVFVLSFVNSTETSTTTPISRSFSFSPIYWGSGLLSLVLSAFNSGETRITTMYPFNVELCAEIIEKYQPTSVQLNPSAMLPFLNSDFAKSADFSSVKMFMCSGSIVNEELRKKYKSLFPEKPLIVFYGLTEVPIAAMFPGDDYEGLKVGKIVSNIYLKVVDDNGKNLDIGETGEIRAKYEFGFTGYYNNLKATAEALDEEEYFKTGDIGYLDIEGNIFVLDRNKDIFKCKGYHVSLIFLKSVLSLFSITFIIFVRFRHLNSSLLLKRSTVSSWRRLLEFLILMQSIFQPLLFSKEKALKAFQNKKSKMQLHSSFHTINISTVEFIS